MAVAENYHRTSEKKTGAAQAELFAQTSLGESCVRLTLLLLLILYQDGTSSSGSSSFVSRRFFSHKKAHWRRQALSFSLSHSFRI